MNYRPVIGIEIHLELLTKSKMFSPAAASFGAAVNSNLSFIDLALPGTLPQVNAEAVRQGIKLAKVLNCHIDDELHFDRKNYFYPDLPKGFQITQQFRPLGSNGFVMIQSAADRKKINIVRMHLEEDTAKQIHKDDATYLDYNRAGVPLIEIVTDCSSFEDSDEVGLYLERIRQLASHIGVSTAKMEEGSLRCDVNISLHLPGTPLGTKVEVKNINSISNVQKALDFEIARQQKILEEGGKVAQETRRYDDDKKETVFMRDKSDAIDYKYFPEPNIFPIKLSQEFINEVLNSIGLLPEEEEQLLINQGITPTDAAIIVANREFYNLVTKIDSRQVKTAVNLLLGDIAGYLNERKSALSETKLSVDNLAKLAKGLDTETISRKHVKLILAEMLSEGTDLEEIVKKHQLVQVSDEGLILEVCRQVVKEFPQAIEDIKAGKDNAYQFLVGQVFKKTKGQASPALAAKFIRQAVSEVIA